MDGSKDAWLDGRTNAARGGSFGVFLCFLCCHFFKATPMVGTPYNGYVFHSIHNRTKYLISARCPNRIRERLVLSSAAALGNLPARFAAVSPNSSACRLAGSAEHAYVFIFSFHTRCLGRN